MKQVEANTTLTEWLRAQYPESSHKLIKQWLAWGEISVNGSVTSNGGMMLSIGDRVERKKHNQPAGAKQSNRPTSQTRSTEPIKIPIIYQDDSLVVIDKPINLLTIATEAERYQTAYRLIGDQLKESQQQKSIFVVHRLDRETSGLLVFARTELAKERLQDQFQKQTVTRRYLAIVCGQLSPPSGRLTHYLAENQQHRVYIAKQARGTHRDAKLSVLDYRVLRADRRYSELEITLQTGRRGQIRAQLAAIDHPIIGDQGSRMDPLKRLGLHAHYLAFDHPDTGVRMEFHSTAPMAFQRLIR